MALENSVLCEQVEYRIEKSSEYFDELNIYLDNSKPIILEIEICRIDTNHPFEFENDLE